jgi:hypothetical protein
VLFDCILATGSCGWSPFFGGRTPRLLSEQAHPARGLLRDYHQRPLDFNTYDCVTISTCRSECNSMKASQSLSCKPAGKGVFVGGRSALKRRCRLKQQNSSLHSKILFPAAYSCPLQQAYRCGRLL